MYVSFCLFSSPIQHKRYMPPSFPMLLLLNICVRRRRPPTVRRSFSGKKKSGPPLPSPSLFWGSLPNKKDLRKEARQNCFFFVFFFAVHFFQPQVRKIGGREWKGGLWGKTDGHAVQSSQQRSSSSQASSPESVMSFLGFYMWKENYVECWTGCWANDDAGVEGGRGIPRRSNAYYCIFFRWTEIFFFLF